MFPFQPDNHTQYFGVQTQYNNPITQDNLIVDEGFLGSGIDLIPSKSNQRERLIIPFGIQENEEKIKNDEVIKVRKFVRSENERQRRQEMANLCGSLRTLLPLEYVTGKRSMSDNLQGAVNYIKDMNNNIIQLKSRRDKLKKLHKSKIHRDYYLPNFLTVNPCPNGFEILINTTFDEEQWFSLSKILRELHERGFNVLSCFWTKVDERSLHRIQLEASKLSLQDLSWLQERLTYMINYPR